MSMLVCAFCGWEAEDLLATADQIDAASGHVRSCEKHPLRAATAEIDRLGAALAEAERKCERLRSLFKATAGLASKWHKDAMEAERERDAARTRVLVLERADRERGRA